MVWVKVRVTVTLWAWHSLQALDRFLEAKAKVDGGARGSTQEQENACMDALHALTSVRAMLVSGLQSGACPRMLFTWLSMVACWHATV